ncbi:hypothetical protein NLJ89_g6662 [Agrocybe chaxingu]|uniref:O-methylsterigmatocystin oxidoreductase n=1 Tax=Agrocybe chaxingu TaxID=84603 RepID=A0A9W8K0E7_9AGAR|nr:hypothetical protein NLJ89_g6662 [Agrocybe chaxingu]
MASPIVYYRVFNQETILVSSGKVALDLLENRSAIYSDRTKAWMAGELAGRGDSVFLSSYSDPRFKIFRRLLQTGLNPRASKSYRPIQVQESHVLLKALATTPEDFMAHIRRNAVAVILKVAYGYEVQGNDDPFVQNIEEGFALSATLGTAGKYWVEFFPILRFVPDWFPGAEFKRYAKWVGKKLHRLERAPFDWAKRDILDGEHIESFTSKHLFKEDGDIIEQDMQENLKWSGAALYVGGGDTTVAALTTFFLVMAQHPEVQRQAQAAVERVAPDRLPSLDDYESLPYIRALIKEILRWAPVAPLGIPHRAMQDDIYENYFIPKGAKILPNIWAMTHDANIYPDPDNFDPSRYLGENPQPDPFRFVFGFGRRVCPGAHLAEMSLFLNICSILAAFDISKPVDESGKEVEPEVEWTTGVTMHLKPFKCQIKPRLNEIRLWLERAE